MRTTAKADYAVRAAVELASAGEMVTGEQIANAQAIPLNFLENILRDLRRAGIVESRRGQSGGYALARPAGEVSVADVIRAVEGPLANVRAVLEQVTLADLARGELPPHVEALTRSSDAWSRR